MGFGDIFSILKESASEFGEDEAPRLAAALSYYALFALGPTIVLLVFIIGQIYNPQTLQTQIINQIQSFTGSQQIADFVRGIVNARASFGGNILATVITLVTLFIGATGLFAQLQDSLNKVWDVESISDSGVLGMIKDRFFSFLLIMGLGLLLVISLAASTVLSSLFQYAGSILPGSGWTVSIADILISGVIFTFLFAIIFKVLPDVQISWSDVWLGAVFTAVLFIIGKQLISLYMGNRALGDVYGAASSLIALLLWVYYSAQIFFFGAEFTQVYARRYGTRIVPESDAISLADLERREEQEIQERRAKKKAAGAGKPAQSPIKESGMPPRAQEADHRRLGPGWRANSPVEPITVFPNPTPLATITAVMGALIGFVSGWILHLRSK